jgi:hypothetical protein
MTGKNPITGRFTAGNRFWEARSSAGPKPIFAGPEPLEKACREYFDWNTKNPLLEDTVHAFKGTVKHEPIARMRAMTLEGLCMFLDVSIQIWRIWRKERDDLKEVIAWAEAVIYRQKFEGASADMLNASIIARDLGLADKRELTGANGGPVQVIDPTRLSDAALAELLGAMDASPEADAG